jgi:maltose alpha-D-glucosyltransferase/alpha-amylase
MPDDFLSDPLWYKDAVIYELHVRSFYDANNDGYGDFQGLREKLPYLERLGVNTLWLLPFLESPLKDDGYDTADYFKVLPVHGDLDDFKAFLDEAHARGMRVITELVLNHTSDQHPWFQEARDPDSDKHDWYVWSDTGQEYEDVRIIFTDTEDSNWAWDPKAQKYYWHRFFSHQPDLNYDNPEVREKMKEVMFFWLDLGVDGLRLDAVPYLFEREGTTSENLPETIDYIKNLRTAIEERYGPGKVLLAEANQWPEDTLPYFGEDADGQSTGVQMAFNFPVMPRMYMALRRENRRPLVEMLEHTADIPEDAQWALFLRNHDELTLEMVTDEERDYMYHEYAAEDRFRINVGIRRRLAPLLGGERRRIELMNALLLSLNGSPILYYGDEIGMGDDPFLGDRNGVRTPMQWSPDKNGGFSRAPHHKLFMPPINRGPYSFEFVNVEDAEQDPHSLLHFTRRILALRNQHAEVFGRGDFELIPVANQSILAFRRSYEGDEILVVANLSRYAQSFHLPTDLGLEGQAPVELFGQSPFPPVEEDTPYHLTLGPHGFYWFALKPEDDVTRTSKRKSGLQRATGPNGQELPVFQVAEGLQNLLVPTMAKGNGPEHLEAQLPGFIAKQRWFGAKGDRIDAVGLEDAVRLQPDPAVYLSILSVEHEGTTDLYTLPLATAQGDAAERILTEHPQAALAWMETETDPDGRYLLFDATVDDRFWSVLFRWWQSGGKGRSLKGVYAAQVDDLAPQDRTAEAVRLLTGEQSNTAAIVNDTFFVKLYRRLERGINPETELLRYLTDAGFTFAPRLHGKIDFRRSDRHYTLGILQEALPVDTDGWSYALEMMGRFLDRVEGTRCPTTADASLPATEETPDGAPVWLEEVAPEMLSLARILGVRTAEMHRTFAAADGDALHPVDATAKDTTRLADRVQDELAETRALLDRADLDLPAAMTPDASGPAGEPVAWRDRAAWADAETRLATISDVAPDYARIRLHGDYHLGQVLRADGEFYLLDFEGEPARSLDERRRRDSALRDVAGMLRSLDYAALAGWQDAFDGDAAFDAWVDALTRWMNALFLDAYLDTAAGAAFVPAAETRDNLLWAYLLDKALYEVRYEINNRPNWAWLPLRGLERLLRDEQPVATPQSPPAS